MTGTSEHPDVVGTLRRFFNADLLSLLMLAAIIWISAGFLLRDDVFIYGDHPGHYWLTWYTLNVAAPLHHRLIDWIPYWYAGYPELQFTPPGYVLLAWLINIITLGRVSTALIYESVAFIAYALPGFTFYYMIRRVGFGPLAAFAVGLFGIVFPAFFDGAIGLFIGMIGSRIAFALDALILVWCIDFVEARGAQYFFLAVLALAVAILAHPYHEIGMMLALGIYFLVRRLPFVRVSVRLLGIVLASLLIDMFWIAPLFAYSSTVMIPIIRSTLDQTWRLLIDESLLPYAILVLPALWRLRREEDPRKRSILIMLFVLLFIVSLFMLADYWILIERLSFYRIDPVRLIGEYYFALILLAGIGVAEIGTVISKILIRAKFGQTALAGLATGLIGLFFLIPWLESASYFQPKENDEPRFLSQAISDYKLDEFWETLRATQGRVLFVSYYSHLNAHGTEPFPTTLTALTPLFSARKIMGGTYSAWSPIAAWMWTGDTHPVVLRGLVENLDDHALFGVPLENLSDAQLVADCQRFNITAVVASVNDFQVRTFLDASPHFQSYYDNGFFFVYRIKDVMSTWIEERNATVEIVEDSDDHLGLHVSQAGSDAMVVFKMYAYPLWHAYIQSGEELPVTHDEMSRIGVSLPRGREYLVTLRYEEGMIQKVGNLISILTITVLGLISILLGLKATRRTNVYCPPNGL